MKYLHISVDLIVIPRLREEIVPHNGKEYVVQIEDGYATVPVDKAFRKIYRRGVPKLWERLKQTLYSADEKTVRAPRVSKGRIKRLQRQGNSWGADWYYRQREQAEKTRAQQKTAAAWKKLHELSA